MIQLRSPLAPLFPALAFALTTGLLSACATTAPSSSRPQPPVPAAATLNAAAGNLAQKVAQAQAAQQANDWAGALALYLELARTSSDVNYAKQAFLIARKLNRADDADLALTMWRNFQPENTEALTLSALLALQAGLETDALNYGLTLAALAQESADAQFSLFGKLVQLGGPRSLPLLMALGEQVRYPEAAWLAAGVAIARHDNARAMALTERALNRNPTFLRALSHKAELLVASGDTDSAVQLLRDSLQAHAGQRLLQLELGRLLYSQGRFNAAAQAFAELRASDPSDPEARYLYGSSLMMAGELAQALPLLQLAASENFQLANAAWLCATAAERLQQLAAAESCYRQIPPGPNYPGARRNLAQLLIKMQRPDEALVVLDKALDEVKKPGEQAYLVQAYLELQLKAGALKAADAYLAKQSEALRKEPLLQMMAIVLREPAQPEAQAEAMLALAKTAETEELRRQWALTGANLLQQQKQHAAAYQLIDGLLSAQSGDHELRYSRALIGETLGKTAQTEADLREVIAINPNHFDAINALGYTLADHKRLLDEALDLVSRAHQQKPTSAAVIDSLGWVYYRRGDLKTAREHLARAYALDPEPEIAAHYGEVLWHLGEKKKAKMIWAQALRDEPDNKLVRERVGRFR